MPYGTSLRVRAALLTLPARSRTSVRRVKGRAPARRSLALPTAVSVTFTDALPRAGSRPEPTPSGRVEGSPSLRATARGARSLTLMVHASEQPTSGFSAAPRLSMEATETEMSGALVSGFEPAGRGVRGAAAGAGVAGCG